MKFFFLAVILTANLYCMATPTTLSEGIKSNKLKVLITGNNITKNPTKSSHTGKCLKITISNSSNVILEVKIENAYHFTNEYDFKQDLISTENYIVKLNVNETKTIAINALCGEKKNASPNETDTFQLAYKHQGSIEKLTTILQRLKTYDNTAQQAMWCFTDNNSIDNIYDTDLDTTIENELVKFVALEKGIAIPKRPYNLNKKIRAIRYPIELIGSHSEHIDRPTTTGFYLTDTTNKVLETIVADDTESRKGTVKYSWGYRGQLVKGTYYFQMKTNGVWQRLKIIKVPEE
jgi:hypothetical protein